MIFLTKLPITKMHGLGNSYVIVRDLDKALERKPGYKNLAIALSDKSYGVGSDGILVVQLGVKTEYRMRIFNPDGSEAEMCGNGIRMFAKNLYDEGLVKETQFSVETYDGSRVVVPKLNIRNSEVESVTVDMGKGEIKERDKTIKLPQRDFYGTSVSVGNPHYVIFDSLATEEITKQYGQLIENHHDFQPNRTNVEFARVKNPSHIDLFVWERGAGFTKACGTGACATAFAGYKKRINERDVKIWLPGGALFISVMNDDTIKMNGPAEYIFKGKIIDLDQLLSHFR